MASSSWNSLARGSADFERDGMHRLVVVPVPFQAHARGGQALGLDAERARGRNVVHPDVEIIVEGEAVADLLRGGLFELVELSLNSRCPVPALRRNNSPPLEGRRPKKRKKTQGAS